MLPILRGRAVDLDPVSLRQTMENLEAQGRALDLLLRVERKLSFTERKAARLPIGNGKRKALADAKKLRAWRDEIKRSLT